jgi:hypothetical protein
MKQLQYTEGTAKLKMSSIGFVTFDSVQTAMLCAQALHNNNPLQVQSRSRLLNSPSFTLGKDLTQET